MSSESSSTRGGDIRFPVLGPTPPLTAGSQQTETALRAAVVAMIEGRGVALASRVVCIAGEPDLVTADRELIIELKWRLTKKTLCAAIGQLLLYRQAINPAARAVIIGYPTPETLALLPLTDSLGVEVVCWQDDLNMPGNGQRTAAPGSSHLSGATNDSATTPAPTHVDFQLHSPEPRRTLRWNVAPLAQVQGIPNPSQLATQLGLARQGLYAIWRGTADQVTLAILGRLAHGLHADPGDWFVWGVGSSGRRLGENQPLPSILHSASSIPLLWNVAEQAKSRGIDMVDLSFRAAVYPRSLKPIWRGDAQAVAPSTLARLALVLDQPGQPFSIGNLFVWVLIASRLREEGG